jgi:hypothetical protein
MRIAEIEFIQALTSTQLASIIPVIEDGLEIQKIKCLASPDEEIRNRISDTCVLLSFLYFRQIQRQS